MLSEEPVPTEEAPVEEVKQNLTTEEKLEIVIDLLIKDFSVRRKTSHNVELHQVLLNLK